MGFFMGLRCGCALRRYALGLAGLLGPAAAKPPWSGASRHPAASLGLRPFRACKTAKGPKYKHKKRAAEQTATLYTFQTTENY